MKVAKDMMTRKPISVLSSDSLNSVAKVFMDNQISTAPVENPLGQVMGVLTELSLTRALLRVHTGDSELDLVHHHNELLEPPYLIDSDASIIEVVNSMLNAPNHRIYVQNNMGNIIGIISPVDILFLLNGEEKRSQVLKNDLKSAHEKIVKMTSTIKSLTTATETYKELYDDAPVMMHSVNEKAVIIMANKKIHDVLGYDESELINKPMSLIYPKSVRHEAIQSLQSIIKTGKPASSYTTMVTQSGGKLRVDMASNSLKDHYGKNVGTITVSRVVDSDNLLRTLHGTLNKEE